jgi:hypothetical protein
LLLYRGAWIGVGRLVGTSGPGKSGSAFFGEHTRMRVARMGMPGAFALLLACAQLSSVPASKPGALPRYMGRIQNLTDYGNGTAGSSNWSGYTVLGASFEWVLGSWIVPKAACTGITGDHFAAFWVGLDGYTSSTVEQIGTLTDCSGKKPFYYAWYEFYPQGMVPIATLTVEPGDHISAWVVYHGKEEFVVTMKDNTTGK